LLNKLTLLRVLSLLSVLSLLDTTFVADEGLGHWSYDSLADVLDDSLLSRGDDGLGDWSHDSS